MITARVASSVALVILACGCARNRINTYVPGVVVRVEPDSVPFVRTPDITKFTLNVIVRNNRPTPLYYGGCWPQAEEKIDGKWEIVWSAVCISELGGSIAPSDSVTIPFTAATFLHENVDPHLDPRAGPGQYRLRLGFAYSGPLNDGLIYAGPRPPQPKTLGELISPVFIVYWPEVRPSAIR